MLKKWQIVNLLSIKEAVWIVADVLSFWSEVVQGRHALQNADDFDWQVQTG